MSKIIWLSITVLLSVISNVSYALPVKYLGHRVRAGDGHEWVGHATVISGTEQFYFIDSSGQKVGKSYDFALGVLDANFGIGLEGTDIPDFNTAYTIELTQAAPDIDPYSRKSCIFVITFKESKEVPDTQVINYKGAKCSSEFYRGDIRIYTK